MFFFIIWGFFGGKKNVLLLKLIEIDFENYSRDDYVFFGIIMVVVFGVFVRLDIVRVY